MELGQLKLLNLLNKRQTISDEEITSLKEKIKLYVFPLSIVPATLINRENYKSYTFIENMTYFNSLNSKLFKNIYLNEEINIINVYMAVLVEPQYTLKGEKETAIFNLLNIDSSKEELQYCLDELRYIYLDCLIRDNSPQTELINSLMDKLIAIEDEHNAFRWEVKI